MHDNELLFVIPTYRLRDVGETIEHYDEHFWRNGHAVRMLVFDDSSPANQEKYYPLLAQTRTHNDVYYVGPGEKEQFLAYLNRRLHDKRVEPLVKDLFRPSYGGNRNYTLMYTLGGLLVSADDDMRPYALLEDSPESLANLLKRKIKSTVTQLDELSIAFDYEGEVTAQDAAVRGAGVSRFRWIFLEKGRSHEADHGHDSA